MNLDERKLRFEEYKLFRDTITHFDDMLINLRKNAIYFSFTLFAAAIAAISFNIPTYIPLKTIDLSIAFIIIELLLVLFFLFLETHYRYYLLKIAEAATEYETKLELGIKLDCDCNEKCDKSATISKCLKCQHGEMEHHIRAAHFYIYAFLLAIGFVALNILIFFRIKIYFYQNINLNEFVVPFIIITLIAAVSPILYVHLNSKKQKAIIDIFDNNYIIYIISIILFMALTYLFYYLSRSFNISYLLALPISVVIFVVLGFRNIIIPKIISYIENKYYNYTIKL